MRAHVIGAGLAGLAAAVFLTRSGVRVSLYEAAPRAGGRCRSFYDSQLGCVIDNGNHLLMSGNSDAMAYLEAIGARDQMVGSPSAHFHFFDAVSGERWVLRPNRGRIPWWVASPQRHVPGTRLHAYFSVIRLLLARSHETVADVFNPGTRLYRCLWEPLTLAALNTAPEQASAMLLRTVLLDTFLKGADACRPLTTRLALAEAFVDPALAALTAAGADVRLGCRARAFSFKDDRVTALTTDDGIEAVDAEDVVVLATPAAAAERLVPGLIVPPPGNTIINLHYRVSTPDVGANVVGVIGGAAQWVFLRGDLASVTISAAPADGDEDTELLAARCWHDVARILGNPALPAPPARVIRERRATFAQTPQALGKRPPTKTNLANLFLAGDWTATGLPATIEGAVRSGRRAAEIVMTR